MLELWNLPKTISLTFFDFMRANKCFSLNEKIVVFSKQISILPSSWQVIEIYYNRGILLKATRFTLFNSVHAYKCFNHKNNIFPYIVLKQLPRFVLTEVSKLNYFIKCLVYQ